MPRGELPRREIRERLNAHQGYHYDAGKSLVSTATPYQKAELVETEAFGRVLLLDGATQVSEKWEYRYHEPMVHPAMLAHPDPQRVLVIGGGDGGILREVLKHKTVRQVDFAELDEAVVQFSREHLAHINAGAFDDPRVHCIFGDGRAFVQAAASSRGCSTQPGYDVVIMDMTDPEGPARFLYTREFFTEVKKTMRGGRGIFVMHGESPAARQAAFACIGKTLESVFPVVSTASTFVPMYGTLWSFRYGVSNAVAMDGAASGSERRPECIMDPASMSAAEVDERITNRMSASPVMTRGTMWPALFAPDPLVTEAEAHPLGRVITDGQPDFPDSFER
ncbi:MAG: fused MFS/spermidine synthase [Clostridia bacterium]